MRPTSKLKDHTVQKLKTIKLIVKLKVIFGNWYNIGCGTFDNMVIVWSLLKNNLLSGCLHGSWWWAPPIRKDKWSQPSSFPFPFHNLSFFGKLEIRFRTKERGFFSSIVNEGSYIHIFLDFQINKCRLEVTVVN